MAPKKTVSLEIIDYKLEQLNSGQRDLIQKLDAYQIRLNTVELWKSKVEDSIKEVVLSARGEPSPLEQHGIKIVLGLVAIVWALVNILGGNKNFQWPL